MFHFFFGGATPPFAGLRGTRHERLINSPFAIILTLALLLAAPAHGAELADQQELRISIGFGAMDFDYQEFDAGERLNHEHGTLFGLFAGAHKRWGKHFVEANTAYFANDVDYDGQTQNGTPVDTDTDQKILESSALYGHYLQTWKNVRHALLAGLGYRYWQRDINSTRTALGVVEIYTWWYGQLGWRGIYQPTARSTWGAEFKLVRPFNAEIDIDFLNALDDTSLALGEETGLRLNLTYQLRLANNWRLEVAGFYSAWDVGRSRAGTLRQNGVAVGTIFEPESETRSAGFRVSGSYTF